MKYKNIERAISDLAAGKFIVVKDSEDREDEADLVMVAEKVTPEAINFLTKQARGLICVSIKEERAKELGFHVMISPENNNYPQELHGCNFAISVDYIHGTSTGISAFDRAKTILAICDKDSKPEDFARPGHMFPLVADTRGVLKRSGHTEAGVELAQRAGCFPAAVICEILAEDGSMAKGQAVTDFANKNNFVVITTRDLIEYVQK